VPPMIRRNSGVNRSSAESIKRDDTKPIVEGLKAMATIVILRDKAIKPLLAAARHVRPTGQAQNPTTIRITMQGVFSGDVYSAKYCVELGRKRLSPFVVALTDQRMLD
jgi:hypothetical protein